MNRKVSPNSDISFIKDGNSFPVTIKMDESSTFKVENVCVFSGRNKKSRSPDDYLTFFLYLCKRNERRSQKSMTFITIVKSMVFSVFWQAKQNH